MGRSRLLPALVLALLVAGCGTAAKKPAPGSKFYLDDGPPETVPADLDAVPDARPRDEPYHRYANRPYTVFGRTYVPVVNNQPVKERGTASWYGRRFHGQKTASGEPYDMFAMTAAHRTFPIPSYVRVTNVKNGKSVVVRVNDRGPFHSNRIIDVSYAAAARLGFVSAGSAVVDVERVFPGEVVSIEPSAAASQPAAMPADVETPLLAQEDSVLWLQLGAFSSRESAESFRARVAREMPWVLEPLDLAMRDGLHRVRMGPYRNRGEALAIAAKVRESLGFAPLLTR